MNIWSPELNYTKFRVSLNNKFALILHFGKTHFLNSSDQPSSHELLRQRRTFHQANLGETLARNAVRAASRTGRFKSKRIEMKILQADRIAAADC
jgi:hypothetical protein